MKNLIIIGAACVALAGCSSASAMLEHDPPPPLTMVIPEPPTRRAPDECSNKHDPVWKNLRAGEDAKQSEAARNYRANKDAFRRLSGRRKVCTEALKAQGML